MTLWVKAVQSQWERSYVVITSPQSKRTSLQCDHSYLIKTTERCTGLNVCLQACDAIWMSSVEFAELCCVNRRQNVIVLLQCSSLLYFNNWCTDFTFLFVGDISNVEHSKSTIRQYLMKYNSLLCYFSGASLLKQQSADKERFCQKCRILNLNFCHIKLY